MMATLDYETLGEVAKDGSMDYDKWPAILEPLLQRLSEIVHSDFPVPTIPPSDSPNSNTATTLKSSESPTQSRNEAQLNSSTRSPRNIPPVPAFSSSSTTHITDSDPVSSNDNAATDGAAPSLPDQVISQLTSIQETLRSGFSEKPPHTIQRLAELVISPKRHYKTLPAWLRAVDRVVSVSSTADIFPLPHAQPLPNNVIDSGLLNGLVNGDGVNGSNSGILWNNSNTDSNLGSDESLGGALLTPIPWLQNHRGAEGNPGSPDLSLLANEAGGEMLVPEREDGGVTQGELIRMEQERGIVPVSQGRSSVRGLENGEATGDDEGNDEMGPHARGPDTVGVEDMGLQNGHDVELQLGRGIGETENETTAAAAASEPRQTQASGPDADAEGDVVLADADGVVEGEEKPQDAGENVGPDAVDSTAL